MATPVGFHQCVTALTDAAGREVTEKEVEEVFGAVQGRIRRYTAEGMSPKDAAVRAGKELGDRIRIAGEIEKRSALINYARRQGLEARINTGSEADDIRAALTGREGGKVGDALSIDAMTHALQKDLLGSGLIAPLERAGLLKVLRRGDKAFDLDVARELWALESGGKSATGNKLARQAAEIVNGVQERTRALQNKAGAWIGKLDHYVTRQSHNARKIRGDGSDAAFARWRDDTLPRLDSRTFDDMAEVTTESVNKFMRDVWTSLASGVHTTARGADLFTPAAGSASLAKRASASRKLHFRSADEWFAYNEQYGDGSLWSSIRGGIESGARNTAIMNVLGTNPEAMYKTVVDRAMARAKDRGDFKAMDALKSTWNERILDVITGKANVPGSETLATFTNWATAIATLSKLGGVVLSSIPDFAVNAATLRHNGVSLFESYGNQIRALVPNRARRETAELAGAGIDGILGDVAARFQAADGAPGTASRLVDFFHKANFLEYWTNSMERGMATMLTHNLGRNAEKEFASLAPRLQRTMSRYGITAADWNTARATTVRAADGRMHLLPSSIEDDALRLRVATYIQDQVREGMTMPDAGTRALTTWGTQAGTAAGAAARIMMQFKTYPVTFVRRTINREINRGEGADVAGIAHIIVATTLLGYAAMELKTLSRGRNTRTSEIEGAGGMARTVAAAMLQGGGAGLYGDFLFGQASRTGGGPVTAMMGPTIDTADDFFKMFQQARMAFIERDPQAQRDIGPSALNFARNNAPFLNMFYLRGVLDYAVWYRLQEAMNPGYLSRYEERVRREQHQTFWLSPAAASR